MTILFGPVNAKVFAGNSQCPSGMSDLDCNALIGGWEGWIPSNNTGICGDFSTSVSGTDNEQKAFNFLVSAPQNLSAIAAAGIVGNLMAESGVDPTNLQFSKEGPLTIPPSAYDKAGYGIAQWTTVGRQKNLIAYAKENGPSMGDPSGVPGNLLVQLNFLWKEANEGYKDVLTRMQAAKTPADAATEWMGPNVVTKSDGKQYDTGGFENPRHDVDHEDVRRSNARGVYELYAKDTPAAATAAAGGDPSDCSSISTSDGFVEYKQCVYRQFSKAVQKQSQAWAGTKYGPDTVCQGGCGPSAMAMIITNLTGQKVTPKDTATYGDQHGTAMPGGGSYWTIANIVGSHWGLKSKELGTSSTAITAALKAGKLVLASGKGSPNPFTVGGHFIVIRAITSDGQWLTGNSAGFDSTKPYTVDHIMAYLQNSWSLEK